MAGSTTNFNFPFPQNGDAPNIAVDIQNLAESVDQTLHSEIYVNSLADTDIDAAENPISDGQVLTWEYDVVSSTGKWVNADVSIGSVALNDISDVNLGGVENPLQDNQLLSYISGEWKNVSVSSAIPTSLDDLSDVSASGTISAGAVLQYVVPEGETEGTWQPQTVSGVSANSFGTITASDTGSSVGISATSSSDSITISAGSNIDIVGDSASKTLTVSVTSGVFQPSDSDLSAIAALNGSTGVLRKSGDALWEIDTSITSIAISNWNTAYGWGNHASAGYSKNVQTTAPVSGSHIVSDSDLGKLVIINNSTSAFTVTVPTTTLAVGAKIDFTQTGTGVVTFSPSGVTIRSKDSKVKLSGQYSAASLTKISSTEWLLVGSLSA